MDCRRRLGEGDVFQVCGQVSGKGGAFVQTSVEGKLYVFQRVFHASCDGGRAHTAVEEIAEFAVLRGKFQITVQSLAAGGEGAVVAVSLDVFQKNGQIAVYGNTAEGDLDHFAVFPGVLHQVNVFQGDGKVAVQGYAV